MSRLPKALLVLPLFLAITAELQADFLIYYIGGKPRAGSGSSGGGKRGGRRGGGQQGGAPGMGPGMGAPGLGPGMGAPGMGSGGGGSGRSSSARKIILPGRAVVNGKTVSYNHPTIKEPLIFSLETVEIKRASTPAQEYQKKVNVASRDKDADAMMKAGVFALKKGMLREFYSALDKALEIDPQHEAALRTKELKRQMEEPVRDNPELEKELRSYIKDSGAMRIATSPHYILLHDTPEKPPKGKRKNRAQERLDLMEQVYQSFMLLFYAQGVELDIPRDRLKVVLFNEFKDFTDFATGLSPALASASGFWEHNSNTSVFFDHGTTDLFKALEEVQKVMHEEADAAKKERNNPELIRYVKAIDLLIEVERENSDITVVSHEAVHQMAGNTGLLPRHVEIPSWVHEGLATYFEAPGNATWAGIGAVNEERLDFYKMVEKHRSLSNIDFIIGDEVFDRARSLGATLNGYAQAWALTHFLLETRLKDFVAYYRILGELPPDVALNPALLTELFNRVFGSDHKAMDQEWRRYMRTLKTDFERLEEGAEKTKA
ncbi:MAG: DUF1570 domain-containing protein [Planctomycetales bacterium]